MLFIVLSVFVSLSSAVVVSLIMAAFILDIDPAIPFVTSLFILMLCPIMFVIDQVSAAVSLANWAYWFLAIGVFLMFYRHIREVSSTESDPGD